MQANSRNGEAEEERLLAEQRAERLKAEQRVINAYHRIFHSQDGQIVLDDLENLFKFSKSAFGHTQHNMQTFDPFLAAVRDGQANVKRHIDHILTQPVQGDANIVGKPKVIR